MCKEYCVYVHKNKTNGKRYCGITSQTPENRWRRYGTGYTHNTHFQNAISKYGWDGFEHTIIASGLTKEEANNLERAYIREFNLLDQNFGYNQTKGGDGTDGYKHTELTKQKMSKSRIGHTCDEETRNKISKKNSGSSNGMYGVIPWNKGATMPDDVRQKISAHRKGKTSGKSHPMYGKKHSDESRRKMSESQKGRAAWNKDIHTGIKPANAKAVGMYNDNGELIKVYQTISEASLAVGACNGNISACCRGRVKHACGYVWKYV